MENFQKLMNWHFCFMGPISISWERHITLLATLCNNKILSLQTDNYLKTNEHSTLSKSTQNVKMEMEKYIHRSLQYNRNILAAKY